jgi:hypothetical protein
MREVWYLPSNSDLQVQPYAWFKSVLSKTPAEMIDNLLLVTRGMRLLMISHCPLSKDPSDFFAAILNC